MSLRNMKRMIRQTKLVRGEPAGEVVRIRVVDGVEVSRRVEAAPEREPGGMLKRSRASRRWPR